MYVIQFQVFDLPGSHRHKYTIREEIRALYGPRTTVPVYLALIFNTLLYIYAVVGTSYECVINVRPALHADRVLSPE